MSTAAAGTAGRPPFRVGLTGGIASGKSTVAELFAARGVPVVDMDIVARQVVAPGSPGLARVAEAFGPGVIGPGGGLDRARLRQIVFSDERARKRLELILHPLIIAEGSRQREAAGGPYQVIVAPLLVEAGLTGWVDRVLLVDCPAEVQIDRLLHRDGGDEDQARGMLAAQASREARLAAADDVIENTGTLDSLARAVEHLDRAYREMAIRDGQRPPGIRLP